MGNRRLGQDRRGTGRSGWAERSKRQVFGRRETKISGCCYGYFSKTGTMMMIRIAAALCFLAVALGAFGAHWLKPTLEANNLVDVWNKAVFYHFIHAIALFVLVLFASTNRSPSWLFFAGIIIFSGSLYTIGLTNIQALGAIAPVGGLCFLAGWAWLV